MVCSLSASIILVSYVLHGVSTFSEIKYKMVVPYQLLSSPFHICLSTSVNWYLF